MKCIYLKSKDTVKGRRYCKVCKKACPEDLPDLLSTPDAIKPCPTCSPCMITVSRRPTLEVIKSERDFDYTSQTCMKGRVSVTYIPTAEVLNDNDPQVSLSLTSFFDESQLGPEFQEPRRFHSRIAMNSQEEERKTQIKELKRNMEDFIEKLRETDKVLNSLATVPRPWYWDVNPISNPKGSVSSRIKKAESSQPSIPQREFARTRVH